MTETSYTPGTWFGIVGAHATVLLPPAAKSRAAAVWALVDDGAGFDDVLDAVVAEGLRGLPAFVLVAGDERTTRVVVRGGATVTAHTASGPVVIEGADRLTWVERSLSDVAGYAVSLDDEAAGDPMVVASGLVRVSGVRVPPEMPEAPAVEPEPAAAEPEDLLSGPIDLDEPEPEPAEEEQLFDDDAPTDVDLPAYQPSGEPAAPAPSFPPPAFPPPVTAPVGIDPLSDPVTDAPDEAESEPEERPAAVRLDFSSGQQIDVDRVVVVGRAPDPTRFSHVDQPLMVTVPSPHQEISSTHLEVRPGTGPEQGTALVTDLGSTNGTVLARPDERPEELRPGVPVALVVGAVIDLGDGLTITVA